MRAGAWLHLSCFMKCTPTVAQSLWLIHGPLGLYGHPVVPSKTPVPSKRERNRAVSSHHTTGFMISALPHIEPYIDRQ